MSLIMLTHVLFGIIAIISGLVAMCAPKGKAWHKQAGKIYVISMLVMAIAGGLASVLLPQAINLFAAFLTGYLVLTSWQAGRGNAVSRGRAEILGLVFISIVAFSSLSVAAYLISSEVRGFHGYGADAYMTIGIMALVVVLGDLNLMFRGSLQGKQKLVRHVWRMCLSYFIAAGSLFEGPGVKIFPDVIKESGALSIPVPLVMIFTLYWVLKLTLPKIKLRSRSGRV